MITNVIVLPEATEVVSLEMAKKHLRLDASFDDEDDLITAYISAAVSYCESFIGGNISATATIKMDDLPLRFKIPVFPVKTITSVSYFPNSASEAVTLAETSYALMRVDKSAYLALTIDSPALPDRFDAVTVVCEIGFDELPKTIIQAVLLLVGDMYERREDRPEVNSTVADKLLRAHKLY
jgi:uncharacterized phiE125 gp8 family phage protein